MQGPGEVALVAVVDGNSNHCMEIERALDYLYRVIAYPNAVSALRGLRTDPANVVLVDELTPPHGGYAFVKTLRREEAFANVPIIFTSKTEERRNIDAIRYCGADTCLFKPYRRSQLTKTVSSLLNLGVERKWDRLPEAQRAALRNSLTVFNSIADIVDRGESIPYSSIKEACVPLVDVVTNNEYKAVLEAVKGHDNYSYVHSFRTATLLCLLGHGMGFTHAELIVLSGSGLLHDVGKMAIPQVILNKVGPLTAVERRIIETHVVASAKYISGIDNIPPAVVTMIEQHHEKLDGSGYPCGLSGAMINDLTRMVSICDVFSAMTDHRVYRSGMQPEKALALMTGKMSVQLDQRLLAMFGSILLESADSWPDAHEE